jgi:hypothetical protein
MNSQPELFTLVPPAATDAGGFSAAMSEAFPVGAGMDVRLLAVMLARHGLDAGPLQEWAQPMGPGDSGHVQAIIGESLTLWMRWESGRVIEWRI